jgi:inner membrane transporter RhtA
MACMVGDEDPAGRGRALVLVLAAIVSVQFGGAVAATLVPEIGAAGSVTLRLSIGVVLLWAVVRPTLRGHGRRAWGTAVAFGTALGAMNLTFYASLAYLHIGVAVTIEFIGPLLLAAALSRRRSDIAAVLAAGLGILLISGALQTSWSQLPVRGIALALTAGACWAAYVVLSSRTGAAFPGLDGLAVAMLVASALIAPWGLTTAARWTPDILWRGVAIAVLSSVIPYSCELVALRTLSAHVFGILLSLEPAVAALAGFLVLGQRLTAVQLVGMSLVVLASAIVMGRRSAAPQVEPT